MANSIVSPWVILCSLRVCDVDFNGLFSSMELKSLKRHTRRKFNWPRFKKRTCSVRICPLSFFCLCARVTEKCEYKYIIFHFLLLFSHTSRSRTKKPNIFSECTRSLLYAWGISLRISDTKNLRLCLFKKVGVKSCYILLWVKVLERNFG